MKRFLPFLLFFFVLLGSSVSSFAQTSIKTYYISPNGSDSNSGSSSSPFKTIQKGIEKGQAGDTISLADGEYLQNITTKRSGTQSAPITIKGSKEAIIKGAGRDRIVEINHSNIIIKGFTIDGLAGSKDSSSGYRGKLIFLLGKEPQKGPNGVKITGMLLKNAGGECIRLRYFAQNNEIARNTIQNCGVHDFVFKKGGKNGEGVYIGTAPEQRSDGKNPTADSDSSNNNWIHHNTFNTQGNECVDIKEGAQQNIIEYNACTGQKDPDSGGFDSRGEHNTFRYNQTTDNVGAGIRLGGDQIVDGTNNNIYGNTIARNIGGGIRIMRIPQGNICGNTMFGNVAGNVVGNFGGNFNPSGACAEGVLAAKVATKPTLAPTQSIAKSSSGVSEARIERRDILKQYIQSIRNHFEEIVSSRRNR